MDLFTEAGQHSHAAILRGSCGKVSGMLSGDVPAGLFAVAELVGVIGDLLVTELFPELSEIVVVGLGQRVSKIQIAASRNPDDAVVLRSLDDLFLKSREGCRELDRRTGLKAIS